MKTSRWTALALTGLAGLLSTTAVALFPQGAAHSAPSPTVVSITWDDTFADSMPALDYMRSHGVPGTLYVNSDRVGFNSQFMTRAQLKSYADAGFEIGGHTLGHVDLTTMSVSDQQANICQDRQNLANLGYRPTSFAYPFGAETLDTEKAVAACGYNSGRLISDLKSPTSCLKCATAEPIPPVSAYAIRTPASVRATFSLADLESEVTNAENDKGGWVPMVFHHICDPASCTGNAIPLSEFTAFVDWLGTQTSVTVKTVDAVVGGTYNPPGNPDPVPDDDAVLVGTKSHVLNGVNSYRCSDCLIEYTHIAGATTNTNAFGIEISVVGGVATQVQNGVGNMAIPPGSGYVLSGHGEAATWLKATIPVGTSVTLHMTGAPPPPPPPPPTVCPSGQVTVGAQSHVVTGVDVARKANLLIVYTPAFGSTTGTNEFGFEAAVVGGTITKIEDGLGSMTIPDNGCVLSGHGEARTWLKTFAVVGANVR
jgi:peptidoglycan/xylan/chitin deacetylase (PgdA/CDA1 family)